MTKKERAFICLFSIIFIILCALFLFIIVNNQQKQKKHEIEEELNMVMKNIQEEITSYNYSNFSILHLASTTPRVKSAELSIKEKAEILDGMKGTDSNILELTITDLQGNAYLMPDDYSNFAERPYFKEALKGNELIYGPIIHKIFNIPSIFYSAPVYNEDDEITNTIFLASKSNFLSEVCEKYTADLNCHAIIMKRLTGLVIGDNNQNSVMVTNIYDQAAETGIKKLHDVMENIVAGKSKVEYVKAPGGKTLVFAYNQIENTDWIILVEDSYKSFF